jgi:DNA adenine methylase
VIPQRPFLKWAGAKTRLIGAIRPLVPANARRLVEPFAGSGAVALNLGLERSVLADTNRDLIDVYRELRGGGEKFISECAALFTAEANSPAVFYDRRTEFNTTQNRRRKAALFVYLNRHGYNGLCRYNLRGAFNVPFGRYVAPHFPGEAMRAFRALVKQSDVRRADFRAVIAEAGAGDFVYCDPPYSPATATANFTAYARAPFGENEQRDLVQHCRAARDRGAFVVISNHDTRETRALYRDADERRTLLVSRHISCNGAKRTKVRELLAIYRPKPA